MRALIKTKSNFKKLNGTIQDVTEVVGNRVSCSIFLPEYGKKVTVDFTKKEVTILE